MVLFLIITELIGSAAFAVSGAMLGLKKKMDLLGVVMLGLTTACGGGLIRDVILGRLPPAMFVEPIYALTAIIISVIIFLPFVRHLLMRNQKLYDRLIFAADAVGLGVFSVYGVNAAFSAGYSSSLFFTVFLGTITGVGGGVLRDVMAMMPPYIFVKDIYCCAAIAGAAVCCLLYVPLGSTAAMLVGIAVVVMIRILAVRFHWSLPKAE